MRARHALVLLVSLGACAGFIEKRAAETTYRIVEKSQVVGRRQADLELARAAMPSGIFQLEAFVLAYPSHRGLKELRAESLCQYGQAFVFDDWEEAELTGQTADAKERAKRVTTLAAACVEANLDLLPAAWREARERGDAAWTAKLASATKTHVPALRWIASADAVTLAVDPLRGFRKLGSILATLERCVALRPGFHDSDAELLLGMLESARSGFLGGADGNARFASARTQLGAGALVVDVMFARGTLVARRDRAAFEKTLGAVVAADLTRWPERRLANELAVRKARRYLAAVERLFPTAP